MAEPEGGSVLLIPKRYLAIGAAALFICAGIPPTDLVQGPGDELAQGRRSIVVAQSPVPKQATWFRSPQLADAVIETPPPGTFVRGQVIAPYKGPTWMRKPVYADDVPTTVPEAGQTLVISKYRQRPNTSYAFPGVQPADIIEAVDHLSSSRRVFPEFSRYQPYRGKSFIGPKTEEQPFGQPIFPNRAFSHKQHSGAHSTFIQAGIPPADVQQDLPVHDRIKVVRALYPYRGKTFWTRPLDTEVPSAAGTILVPSSRYPDAFKRTFVRGLAVPPADVVVGEDAENWTSRRASFIPAQPYRNGQFFRATFPVADVIVPDHEEGRPSNRRIILGDYSDLWRKTNLSFVRFYQIEDDIELFPGSRCLVIPPPEKYSAGQFLRGTIERADIFPGGDELISSRRLVIDTDWYRQYRPGGTSVWTPLLDEIFISGRTGVYLITVEDRSLRVDFEDRTYRIPFNLDA